MNNRKQHPHPDAKPHAKWDAWAKSDRPKPKNQWEVFKLAIEMDGLVKGIGYYFLTKAAYHLIKAIKNMDSFFFSGDTATHMWMLVGGIVVGAVSCYLLLTYGNIK